MRNKILILIGLMSVWACSEEQLATYNGEYNSVYFAPDSLAGTYSDSLMFSFATTNDNDTTLLLVVRGVGDVVDFDRVFNVVLDSATAEEGKHFEPIASEYVLKAGRTKGYIPVTLHRTADLAKKELAIHLRLVANEYFGQQLIYKKQNSKDMNITCMSVWVTGKIAKPKVWIASYFGYFSEAKIIMINQLLDINPTEWNSTTVWPIGRIIGISNYMTNYLNDQVDKNDPEGWKKAIKDPSLDSHRGYMTFPGVSIPASWPDMPQSNE